MKYEKELLESFNLQGMYGFPSDILGVHKDNRLLIIARSSNTGNCYGYCHSTWTSALKRLYNGNMIKGTDFRVICVFILPSWRRIDVYSEPNGV